MQYMHSCLTCKRNCREKTGLLVGGGPRQADGGRNLEDFSLYVFLCFQVLNHFIILLV